jgi:endonuclease/exonuclease/phosphatase (EEP) superfamily protein YafD
VESFFKNIWVERSIAIFIIGLTLACLFTPAIDWLTRIEDLTPHIALLMLMAGMFFLVFSHRKLMFLSLISCGLLCMFLKQASNSNLIFPEENREPFISVAHINVSSSEQGYQAILDKVKNMNPEVVSFQEVTPDWDVALQRGLSKEYPYSGHLVRIDPFGMAIFSKLPINKMDTFYYKQIPNLITKVQIGHEKEVEIVSSYILPPLNRNSGMRSKEHLYAIAEKINKLFHPVIMLGDFNMVYWSNELRTFRGATQLENSRRDVSLTGLKMPYDHIFYSPDIECTSFREITDSNADHLGIMGMYQMKKVRPLRETSLTSQAQ